jgi:hypothetical protein
MLPRFLTRSEPLALALIVPFAPFAIGAFQPEFSMNTQHRNRIKSPAAPVLRFAITRHVCAMLLIALAASLVNAQGPLVAWGDDSAGMVSGAPSGSFVAVAAGSHGVSHAVGIRTNGTLASWGDPVMVNGTPSGTFTAVATSGRHALAIRSDGTLASWGQSGLEGLTPAGTFTAVATSGWHAVAIRSDGTLAAWGNELDWCGGPGSQVSGPNSDGGTFIAVACVGAAGGGNTRAIRADGTIAAWGGDPFSCWEAYPPSGTFSAISANEYYNAAIRTSGSLVEWTGLSGGELETPGPFVALATVAGASWHPYRIGTTIAIHVDGTLVGLGEDHFGLVSGIPAGKYSAVAAAGGSYPFTGGVFCVAIGMPTGNQPPVITCNDPVTLWSPNHELVDAGAAFSVDDPDGDPVAVSIRVFSDETEIPDTGDGTGKHAPDFKALLASGAQGLFLRSERRGTEDGRFYLGLITADDGNGGVTQQVCILAVCPRDQTQQSLDDVLAQAAGAAGAMDFPTGLHEHGLSAPLGPNQ